MTNKVRIPQKARTIDKLMNGAIKQVSGIDTLGPIDSGKHYHYANLALLLEHLRFIADTDPDSVPAPLSLFREHPSEAYEAYEPYWGSYRDAQMRIDYDPWVQSRKFVALHQFLDVADVMLGEVSADCQGSIHCLYDRLQYLSVMEMLVSPTYFSDATGNNGDPHIERFLQLWSNEQLWNRIQYERFVQARNKAEQEIAAYYSKSHKQNISRAAGLARRAVAGVVSAYLGQFPKSAVEEEASSLVYKTFTRKNLQLKDLSESIKEMNLPPEDLRKALRLAILNDAEMLVIQALIKEGAPLTGDVEPALFTAVRRPEIVRLLINSGAEVNEQNALGKTALHQAAQYNCLDTLKLLCTAKADVNRAMEATDDESLKFNCDYNYTVGLRTPLMYACMFSGAPLIRFLVEHGADKLAVDSSKANAKSYLKMNKLLSAAEKLSLKDSL